jgi:hypothetical protein
LPASDVFSFSIILWELVSWKIAYENLDAFNVCLSIREGQRLEIPECELKNLIGDCWQQEPQARPSFAAIISILNQVRGNVEEIEGGLGKRFSLNPILAVDNQDECMDLKIVNLENGTIKGSLRWSGNTVQESNIDSRINGSSHGNSKGNYSELSTSLTMVNNAQSTVGCRQGIANNDETLDNVYVLARPQGNTRLFNAKNLFKTTKRKYCILLLVLVLLLAIGAGVGLILFLQNSSTDTENNGEFSFLESTVTSLDFQSIHG